MKPLVWLLWAWLLTGPIVAESRYLDVVYARPGGVPVKLDLYVPAGSGPYPLIIMVHGGGWVGGDKSLPAHRDFMAHLMRSGFAVASINYRLAPRYRFPAQIEDAKAAVRFLRANASQYHLDPKRFGGWGWSAGGNQVSLLALAGPKAGWDVGDHLDQSSGLQAVADWFSASDVTQKVSPLARSFVEAAIPDKLLRRSSTITWVHSGAPPFFIVQGADDTMVPARQSVDFAKALEKATVPVTLVVVQHAGHGLKPVGGLPDPPVREVMDRQLKFFKAALQVGQKGDKR